MNLISTLIFVLNNLKFFRFKFDDFDFKNDLKFETFCKKRKLKKGEKFWYVVLMTENENDNKFYDRSFTLEYKFITEEDLDIIEYLYNVYSIDDGVPKIIKK